MSRSWTKCKFGPDPQCHDLPLGEEWSRTSEWPAPPISIAESADWCLNMPKPVHHPSHEVLFQMAVMGVLAILVMINLGSEWDQEKNNTDLSGSYGCPTTIFVFACSWNLVWSVYDLQFLKLNTHEISMICAMNSRTKDCLDESLIQTGHSKKPRLQGVFQNLMQWLLESPLGTGTAHLGTKSHT